MDFSNIQLDQLFNFDSDYLQENRFTLSPTDWEISEVFESTSGPSAESTAGKLTDTEDEFIWRSKGPSPRDIKATKEFLALVASKKYRDMLYHPKKLKRKLWVDIGREMSLKGYRIADSVIEVGSRCHKKWLNLERSYRRSLGKAFVKSPRFFDEMHGILKNSINYRNWVAKYGYKEIDVHVSKREKMEEPRTECTDSDSESSMSHRQPTYLESVAESMESLERDMRTMIEKHEGIMEKLMEENDRVNNELANVLSRIEQIVTLPH